MCAFLFLSAIVIGTFGRRAGSARLSLILWYAFSTLRVKTNVACVNFKQCNGKFREPTFLLEQQQSRIFLEVLS